MPDGLNNVLKDFCDDGIIVVNKNIVTIHNMDKLKSLSKNGQRSSKELKHSSKNPVTLGKTFTYEAVYIDIVYSNVGYGMWNCNKISKPGTYVNGN
jgi:hypothetical protein